MLLLALVLAGAALSCAQTEQVTETSDELFRSRCLACHVPPDPHFSVERAWLEQVLDTA